MEFIDVPERMLAARPWVSKLDVGPPPGVSLEHCSVAHSTFEVIQGGPHDGAPCYRVYATLDRHEIAMLEAGTGVIELTLFGQAMPMHALTVVPT